MGTFFLTRATDPQWKKNQLGPHTSQKPLVLVSFLFVFVEEIENIHLISLKNKNKERKTPFNLYNKN